MNEPERESVVVVDERMSSLHLLLTTHKLGRCFLCVCCVLVRCVWVFAGCVCV